MKLDYAGLFQALQPEAHLVLGALLVLGFDLAWARHRPANRHHVALLLGLLALGLAAWKTIAVGAVGPAYGGVLMIDSFAVATRFTTS